MVTVNGISPVDIPYQWSSLTKEQQESLLKQSPLVAPLTDSLTWMRKWTRSWDEHDTTSPNKPIPGYEYFDVLHQLFLAESRLFVEKSRTVMATWWGAGECLHYVMTHQPASCIFWCPDEDRAIKCIKYCKVFYGQQHEQLKTLYPLPRKKKAIDDQAVYRFELAAGGWLEALPGKNPDKIRSEHPTLVFMDEIAFNERGAEAYANAVSTRPQKLIAISSAYPGWFYDMIEPAETIPLPVLE
jgi:phage FluMu gp28-like protein